MWLRDSAAQVRPYLSYIARDTDLRRILKGIVQRQMHYITIDAYANAFNRMPDSSGHQQDRTEQNLWLWERKYELDSLCYPVQLAWDYWSNTGGSSIFDDTMHQTLTRIVAVITCEQRHDSESPYFFERFNCPPSDALPFEGRGTRTNFTGMSWSDFRPSDDACKFGYLVPSSMFAVVILRHLAQFTRE
jgi:uncharacterized protein